MESRVCDSCKEQATRYWQNSEYGTILCYVCHARLGREGGLHQPNAEAEQESIKIYYGVFPLRGQYDRYIAGHFVVQAREEGGDYPYPYSTLEPMKEYHTLAAARWLVETLNQAQK